MAKYYYCPSSKGFYNTDIHAREQIPVKAIGISKTLYETLRDGQSGLKKIALNAEGIPVLVDVEVDDNERGADVERHWRDMEIERLRWLRERHRDETELAEKHTLTANQYGELLTYLQHLRGWPQSERFPDAQHRPVVPPWLSDAGL